MSGSVAAARRPLSGLAWLLRALREGPIQLRLFPPGTERYATRSLEAYLAGLDMLFGAIVLLPFVRTLENDIYSTLLGFVPDEAFWGALLFGRGALHALALRINGHAWWTPYARAAASGVSVVFWALFLATILTGTSSMGLIFSLAVVNVLAHVHCVRRSGRDAGIALNSRNA